MLNKQEFYENEVWPGWIDEIRRSASRTILLHGIMGSELYDRKRDDTVWVDWEIWHDIDNLEFERISPTGAVDIDGQFIYARSTLHPPVIDDPYSELLNHLDIGRFNFDWRESMPIEASRLYSFLKILLEDKKTINFVTHSMGGCILLWLLGQTDEFDEFIDNIIFCAPPFHGALKPIRVIEDGEGSPIDLLIRNATLRKSSVTMPGLFQLLVSPQDLWLSEIEMGNGDITLLKYPILGGIDLYKANAWTNKQRQDLRMKILDFASRYHREKRQKLRRFVDRLGNKTNVIVGLNGKTSCLASFQDDGGWRLHKVFAPPAGKISNGDGTVLFQSSILPNLPIDRYWAEIPEDQKNLHGGLVDRKAVINAIGAILNNRKPDSVDNYKDFIERIDWNQEKIDASDPGPMENLDYIERARLRETVPLNKWGNKLNPDRKDALTFNTAREAAIRVTQGEDISVASKRIGQQPEFLIEHIRTMLMPILYG